MNPTSTSAATNSQSTGTGSSLTNSPAPAPPAGQGSNLVKVVLIIGALILFFLLAAMGSCVYIGYRAKQKAEEIEAAYQRDRREKAADQRGVKHAGETHSAPVSSGSTPANSDASSGLAVPGTSAPPATTSSVPADLGSVEKPVASKGDPAQDWALRYERTEAGPEADLVVRTGDINNLGFGWPKNFDPFSGKSTYPHPFPWVPKPGTPDGTDQMLLGSAVTPADFKERPFAGDGYTNTLLRPCQEPGNTGP